MGVAGEWVASCVDTRQQWKSNENLDGPTQRHRGSKGSYGWPRVGWLPWQALWSALMVSGMVPRSALADAEPEPNQKSASAKRREVPIFGQVPLTHPTRHRHHRPPPMPPPSKSTGQPITCRILCIHGDGTLRSAKSTQP